MEHVERLCSLVESRNLSNVPYYVSINASPFSSSLGSDDIIFHVANWPILTRKILLTYFSRGARIGSNEIESDQVEKKVAK